MNLLTLIGAAAVCEDFCELLAKNPARAAQVLGLVLTELEVSEVKAVFEGKDGDRLCQHLGKLNTFFCKKQPCAFAPVILDEDFGKKTAAA